MNKKVSQYSIVAVLVILLGVGGFVAADKIKNTKTADVEITNPILAISDTEYKSQIIKSSKNPAYKVENLAPLVGPQELSDFIVKNSNNPTIYTPSQENIKNGEYRANLHMHTLNSDGSMSVKELMDQAQDYAKDFADGEYMYVAVTDHNTVLGAQDVIKVLQENPNKYNKIKVVAGIEINTSYNNSEYKPYNIHVLLWAVNPYDEFLCKEFYKADLTNKINRKSVDPDFYKTISTMKKYGVVGVAHPARYISHMGKDYYKYLDEMFKKYIDAVSGEKVVFTEGYYQTYTEDVKSGFYGDFENVSKFIHKKAKELGIVQTGSNDTHGKSIFTK